MLEKLMEVVAEDSEIEGGRIPSLLMALGDA
jgi:hypothetical protein